MSYIIQLNAIPCESDRRLNLWTFWLLLHVPNLPPKVLLAVVLLKVQGFHLNYLNLRSKWWEVSDVSSKRKRFGMEIKEKK